MGKGEGFVLYATFTRVSPEVSDEARHAFVIVSVKLLTAVPTERH